MQLIDIQMAIINCQRCSRLRAYCQCIAQEKRRAYFDQEYWGKPVPGFGDPAAHILLVGLAPGAHGANRTGRVFTGDPSGDFLFAALYRAGFCNKPVSQHRADGLQLFGIYIAGTLRCAPPQNKPLASEIENCRPFLHSELDALNQVHTILALGKLAFDQLLVTLAARGESALSRPSFFHGAEHIVGKYRLAAVYHPSQRNTATRRLTPAMYHTVLSRLA